jgi:hypothetical protein
VNEVMKSEDDKIPEEKRKSTWRIENIMVKNKSKEFEWIMIRLTRLIDHRNN